MAKSLAQQAPSHWTQSTCFVLTSSLDTLESSRLAQVTNQIVSRFDTREGTESHSKILAGCQFRSSDDDFTAHWMTADTGTMKVKNPQREKE